MNEIEQVKNEVVKFDSSAVITITDNESYIAGGERRKAAARFIKAAHEKFDSDILVAHNHHKSLVAKLREIIAPVGTWMKKVDRQLLDYDTEQENIRLEAEAKAREQARKIEEERKLAEAIVLEAQGDKKESEQVMSEPVYVPPVVIQKTVPKVQGVSYTERWRGECIDKVALIKAAAIDPQLCALLKPDDVAINQMARSLRDSFLISGCRAIKEKTDSGRLN